MIRLFQFPPVFDLPTGSSFCLKVETYLRMTGLEFETVTIADPRKSPKGKLPYIEDGGRTVADSRFILDHLKATYGDPLDDSLSEQQRILAGALIRLIEESLYFAVMYSRWVDPAGWAAMREPFFAAIPAPLRPLFAAMVRAGVVKALKGQGTGRLNAEEVLALAASDFHTLAEALGGKPYFLGEAASSLDASAYGLLAQVLFVPAETGIKKQLLVHDNLCAFCDRVRQAHYA
ncbi:MAG: glutathione S-transferase family protein [Rhodospirillales bacterium]|nr:glutathione S-transferase family protein [Rhodospirillales bacterium]